MSFFSFTYIFYKLDKLIAPAHSAILDYPALRILTPDTNSKMSTWGGLIFTIILFLKGIYHTNMEVWAVNIKVDIGSFIFSHWNIFTI